LASFGGSIDFETYISFFFVARANNKLDTQFQKLKMVFEPKLANEVRSKVVHLCEAFIHLDENRDRQCLLILENHFNDQVLEPFYLALLAKSLRVLLYLKQSIDAGRGNWDDQRDDALRRSIQNFNRYMEREVNIRHHVSERDLFPYHNFADIAEAIRVMLPLWTTGHIADFNRNLTELEQRFKGLNIAHQTWLNAQIMKLKTQGNVI
jgi:hypothetical protein